MTLPAHGAQPARMDRVDALRGFAIVWMALFHFAFDLNYFGLLSPRQSFYTDPIWTGQRSAIVSLFVFTAGLSQAIAFESGQPWQRFWRRWAQIAVCALLVSAGSALMFPRSWISFGILHGLALMLIVTRCCAPLRGRWLWPLGVAAILLPQWLPHPAFDAPWGQWTGLVTRKPVTEDYAPLLPWLGVMLWGCASGRWLMAHRPAMLAGALPRGLRPLAWLGGWSLTFYMLHQPVLIGALLAWRWASGAAGA